MGKGSSTVTVLDVFEGALGKKPRAIVDKGRALTAADLALVLEAHQAIENAPRDSVSSAEVWPLVSHHTYDNRPLFGARGHNLLPRALTLLLLHDGLVAADPLVTVAQTLQERSESEAVRQLNRTVSELAMVEQLIGADVLRLTTLRPSLSEANRLAVLEAMGLDSDLRVFTNFLEAAATVRAIPGLLEREYAPQVRQLYRLFGRNIPMPSNVECAEALVTELAAAVIEVSWQFSVVALDPACDLAFRSPLERHLAEALIDQGLAGDLGVGRHLSTLHLGRVPNLDASQLSVADAIAIRREDSFEAFRRSVRIGLDQLEDRRRGGAHEHFSRAAFEDYIRQEAQSLRESARRARFGELIVDNSVTAMLGVVTPFLVADTGSLQGVLGGGGAAILAGHPAAATAAAAGISALAVVISQWLLARARSSHQTVSMRYFSMLGNEQRAAS